MIGMQNQKNKSHTIQNPAICMTNPGPNFDSPRFTPRLSAVESSRLSTQNPSLFLALTAAGTLEGFVLGESSNHFPPREGKALASSIAMASLPRPRPPAGLRRTTMEDLKCVEQKLKI